MCHDCGCVSVISCFLFPFSSSLLCEFPALLLCSLASSLSISTVCTLGMARLTNPVSIHWSAKARWKCFGRAAVNQFWKEIELHRLWNVCICKIRSVSIVDPLFICLETWPTQKMWHSLILSKLVWLKFTLCYSLMSLPTCCFKSVKHRISDCT